jgi:hypothetical protein
MHILRYSRLAESARPLFEDGENCQQDPPDECGNKKDAEATDLP